MLPLAELNHKNMKKYIRTIIPASLAISYLMLWGMFFATPAITFAGDNSAGGGSGVDPGFDGTPFDPEPELPEFSSEPSGGGLSESTITEVDIRNLELYDTLERYVTFFSIGVGLVLGIGAAYSGIQVTSSRGNPGKVAKAVQRLTYIAIAAILYVFSYVIFEWLIPGGAL